ncbi:glycosyltransferase family 2 protein [Carnobacterium inhibens]|uniref:glycosyltransferase family 2 protein n=1 Tax=Carnobacterium inhibens TaxID=147709 RepID=UPI00203BFF78|nr:glycosyltransferase family 2 protein [Carnobacterium inhibens]MCM3511380.1 glycosyltransferase [Carnobacterium inhibens]
MNNKLKISVIMATFNCENTIREAIDSILHQTYKDWELIVCDDCSTDNTYDILQEYEKKNPIKIKLLRNSVNSKLSYSLNRCLKLSSGEYIARMDGDDISKLDRLEKQIKYLQSNTNIQLVGTAMRRFSENGEADVIMPIAKPDKYTLRKTIPFYHATIMTYKYVYDKLNGYTVSKRTIRSQDRDLWFRFYYSGFSGQNIKEPLYMVRENIEAIKRRTIKVRWNSYKTTMLGYKLLEYPSKWYIWPTFELIYKIFIPDTFIVLYRSCQKRNLR